MVHKEDVVREVAKRTGITQKEVKAVLETTADVISEALNDDNVVMFKEFGKFELKHYASKNVQHPTNGSSIQIPEKLIPSFKASKILERKVGFVYGADDI